MKICLIMPNVFPVPATKGGATETLMTNLLKENEKNKKIDFLCVSVYEEEAEQLSKNYKNTEFIYIKQKRDNLDLTFEKGDSNFINYMDEIYENIKDREFDFLVIEGGDVTGYEYLLKKFPKEKCLLHIHGYSWNVSEHEKEVNKRIYSKFLAISKYTKQLIIEDQGIEPDRVELLYNAIYTNEFDKEISEEEKRELRKKHGINENDNVILFIGRTMPQKGVKELILAFKKLRNIENSKILIVGSANYGAEVKTDFDYELERISEDIKDKIRFTGYIKNTEIYKIQNICDIAVVPSMWEELFGLVVVENLANGLPLVVTRAGGIPEIVDDECAFVVDKDENLIDNLADRIDYLIDNPEIRKKMGEHAKQRSKIFDMDRYLDNFYNVMKKIKNEN